MRIFMYLYTQIRIYIMYKDTINQTTDIKTCEGYHVPVLLDESISGLGLKPGGVYVDVTLAVEATRARYCRAFLPMPISTVSIRMPTPSRTSASPTSDSRS